MIIINSGIEVVDRFCYLGDPSSVDGSADAAVTARIQCTVRNKFRQLPYPLQLKE